MVLVLHGFGFRTTHCRPSGDLSLWSGDTNELRWTDPLVSRGGGTGGNSLRRVVEGSSPGPYSPLPPSHWTDLLRCLVTLETKRNIPTDTGHGSPLPQDRSSLVGGRTGLSESRPGWVSSKGKPRVLGGAPPSDRDTL